MAKNNPVRQIKTYLKKNKVAHCEMDTQNATECKIKYIAQSIFNIVYMIKSRKTNDQEKCNFLQSAYLMMTLFLITSNFFCIFGTKSNLLLLFIWRTQQFSDNPDFG